jgi:predicted nucleic acid-binding Zn ribbon protein
MLVQCEACGAKISESSKACVQCGHPLKKSKRIYLSVVLALLSVLALVSVWKVYSPSIADRTVQPAASTSASTSSSEYSVSAEITKETHRQMMLRAVRENAHLPKMVSPFIRHIRTSYDVNESTMTYTYQVMNEQLFNESVMPAISDVIKQTYCSSANFAELRTQRISAQWLYLSGGRELFIGKVSRC